MKTKLFTVIDTADIVTLLQEGEVVAFPTDTVYGAAVRYDSPAAILKLKQAKERPESKPFPMMVADVAQIRQVAFISAKAEKLIHAFMPGAITLVFAKRPEVSDEVTNGYATIAIRMPDDDWVRALIRQVGVPLLVPSANQSGLAPAHTDAEVLAQLDGRIAGVVRGESGRSVASTIVDVSNEQMKILREGPISLAEIQKVWEE